MTLLAALLVLTSMSTPATAAVERDHARYEDRILELLNADRRAKGLRPVQRVTQLDAVARTWSAQMARERHMYHNPSYSQQIPSGWRLAGENVAYGYQTPEAMYRGWYNSPGHYRNMFDPEFTHIGIGVVYANDPTFGLVPYGTQNFAKYESKSLTTTPRPAAQLAAQASARQSTDDGGIGGTGKEFHLADNLTGPANHIFQYGYPNERFYVGDWNGDGVDTLAYRVGATFFIRDSNSSGSPTRVVTYGRPGDRVYVGDWDGDGVDTFAVRRGKTYHVKNSISSGNADKVIAYGREGDDVLVGDWDGNGTDTFAVRRGRTYHVKNSMAGGNADKVAAYGREADDVYVGDWNGDGTDSFTVRRGKTYYIANAIRGGNADQVVAYGRDADTTLVGDWNGDGRDSLGIRR
ncbi:CAP domain-containing protein [Georgenia phoenicis]|uniref:CAP domain-containing protein n=1 Tax=unclassified Georgenia TaxID=2626815 RepID=UPI0039AFA1A2